MHPLKEIFGVSRPIIGMVHLPPLPGSPKYRGQSTDHLLEFSLSEAKKLENGGVDGLIIENLGDAPYLKSNVGPETISIMTLIACKIANSVKIPVGVNVLRNDAKAALAIAHASGGKFIRVNVFTDTMVTEQGIIEPVAPELLRYRGILKAEEVKIFADVQVKHGIALVKKSIEQSAQDAAYRGRADALIITGEQTGAEPKLDDLIRAKEAVRDKPILIGSGVNEENVVRLLPHADAAIVGTYFKKDGITSNQVDEERVKGLMEKVKSLRSVL
jgi:membrane complex biogenesis BtpA family protein